MSLRVGKAQEVLGVLDHTSGFIINIFITVTGHCNLNM